VNERLEEPRTEEVLSEVQSDSVPKITAPGSAWSGPSWLRMAYALEFLIAMIATFSTWSQVGGQGHMDLLPWYIKLACSLSLSWCCVRFTAALVEHEKAWNHHSFVWFIGMIMVALVMGGITYYYHLHEVPDEPDTDDTTATSVTAPDWRLQLGESFRLSTSCFLPSSDRRNG
jgi:hypothetical protein